MPLRVAINGFGRIGRTILRAQYESLQHPDIQIVAINDPGSAEALTHLFRYDSTHGSFKGKAVLNTRNKQNYLEVNGDSIQLLQETDADKLPWKALNIDIILECSGQYRSYTQAQRHCKAGAGKVIIGAPANGKVDRTVVYGVNHQDLRAGDHIISNASCTTNCIAPILQALSAPFDIQSGMLTTIHSYSNNQNLIDSTHSDLRRARSATQSLIPTSSGALSALGEVLPKFKHCLTGYSMRVPTLNVAAVDLTLQLSSNETSQSINAVVKQAAERDTAGVLAYSDEPLVSIDFNQHTASSVFDSLLTKTAGQQVKLVAWYDNEWAYAHRMLDLSSYLAKHFF